MLDYPFYRRNTCQLLWRKRRSHSKGRRIKRPLRRRLHHHIKKSSRTGIREPGLCHSENKPVLTVASERRKVKGNGAGPLRRRLHHHIKKSSRTGIREPGLCHSENKPVLTVASERRKVKGNGAGSSFSFTGLCSLKSSIKRIRDTSRGAI